jgi:hypothetical protein
VAGTGAGNEPHRALALEADVLVAHLFLLKVRAAGDDAD